MISATGMDYFCAGRRGLYNASRWQFLLLWRVSVCSEDATVYI
jgi:hypothetical protein